MLRGRPAALILVAVAMFFFVVSGAGPASAFQYLGQVTWSWHKTMNELGQNPDKYETIVAKLFLLGNSCYEVVGSSTDTESGGTSFGTGTAMLVGSNLIMTISTTKVRADGQQDTAIFQGQVDTTSFNGSGWNIKKRFDPISHSFTDKYGAGTLTLVGNKPPLGPATAAPLQLLLSD